MEELGMGDPKQLNLSFSAENITRGSRTSSLTNVSITLMSQFVCKAEYKTKEHRITLMGNNDSLMSSPL